MPQFVEPRYSPEIRTDTGQHHPQRKVINNAITPVTILRFISSLQKLRLASQIEMMRRAHVPPESPEYQQIQARLAQGWKLGMCIALQRMCCFEVIDSSIFPAVKSAGLKRAVPTQANLCALLGQGPPIPPSTALTVAWVSLRPMMSSRESTTTRSIPSWMGICTRFLPLHL